MNDNLPKPQQTEEVDLGQLFNAIGNGLNKFYNFLASIFKAIFSVVIYTIKALLDNWKVLVGAILLAFIAGKFLENSSKDVYSSQMLVKPYFDSKYQLVDNIEYYNALISTEDYETLSGIFSLEEEDVEQILSFEINPGPETENERIVQYDRYVRSIDSIRALDISFDDFIENRSIYSGSFFEVYVESYKKDIFPNLEGGLNSSFTNKYSLKKMEKRDSMISLQKANILKDIDEVKELQRFYINVLKEESKSNDRTISLGENFSLSTENKKTREYDLLNQEILLRTKLRKLDEQQIEEDVFFDIISSFQQIGSPTKTWKDKYSLLFPILVFVLLSLLYLFIRLIRYVNNYED